MNNSELVHSAIPDNCMKQILKSPFKQKEDKARKPEIIKDDEGKRCKKLKRQASMEYEWENRKKVTCSWRSGAESATLPLRFM